MDHDILRGSDDPELTYVSVAKCTLNTGNAMSWLRAQRCSWRAGISLQFSGLSQIH